MQVAELLPPYPTQSIDPLSIAPDPGPMGQMYIGAREAYADGMTLATATPLKPYGQLIEDYTAQSGQPEFSDVKFFEENFVVDPTVNAELPAAKPGQSALDYAREVRGLFVFPNTRQSHFDVWLPYDRVVAGVGRFGKHSFQWDGYHMSKGHAADGKWNLVLSTLYNTEYEINTYGHPINGSADFYVTRPQIDYFAHGVRMLADKLGPEALVRFLPAMEKNHMGYWMDGMDQLASAPNDGKAYAHRSLVRMPDGSFLNRYWDDADGPRLESYKEDVEEGELVVAGLTGVIRDERLKKYYKDKRAGATSGWDYSSRWFEDPTNPLTINTTDVAPVDLNSLMAYNEETLAMAYEAAASTGGYQGLTESECLEKAGEYWTMYRQRVQAINKYNWDPASETYRDYNFEEQYQTSVLSAAMVYPLYVGISSEEQSLGVADSLEENLLYDYGIIATDTEESTQQWDGGKKGGNRSKNVWAPFNWAAVRGLARAVHKLRADGEGINNASARRLLTLSSRIRKGYMRGIELAFENLGVIPEKHRGDDPTNPANGGEYALVKLLGMSCETYVAMYNLDPNDAQDHLPRWRYGLAA